MLAILPLLLIAGFEQAQSSNLPQLCDAAPLLRDGQEVRARGTIIFDQHGNLFADVERRCALPVTAARDSVVWERMIRLSLNMPARIDATARGRLVWRQQSPGLGLPKGFWIFEVSQLSHVEVTGRSVDEMLADLKSWPDTVLDKPRQQIRNP